MAGSPSYHRTAQLPEDIFFPGYWSCHSLKGKHASSLSLFCVTYPKPTLQIFSAIFLQWSQTRATLGSKEWGWLGQHGNTRYGFQGKGKCRYLGFPRQQAQARPSQGSFLSQLEVSALRHAWPPSSTDRLSSSVAPRSPKLIPLFFVFQCQISQLCLSLFPCEPTPLLHHEAGVGTTLFLCLLFQQPASLGLAISVCPISNLCIFLQPRALLRTESQISQNARLASTPGCSWPKGWWLFRTKCFWVSLLWVQKVLWRGQRDWHRTHSSTCKGASSGLTVGKSFLEGASEWNGE